MKGVRLPDAVMGKPGPGWEAWENGGTQGSPSCAPGSYMKVTVAPGKALWYIKDPDGEIGSLTPQHHKVIEHEDGTITVTPSILAKTGGVTGWHGWLECGAWRSA